MVAGTAEIWIDEAEGVVFAAVVDGGGLVDLLADRRDGPGQTGAVFLGKVTQVDKAAGAAFVDLGLDREGYLKRRGAAAAVAEGAVVAVQVTSESRGAKGAELTLDLALPGRFLVHTPRSPGVTVSRALGGDAKRVWRDRLAKFGDGGWVVRRAAAGAAEGEVLAEAMALMAEGTALLAKAGASPAPARLLPALGVAERLILDHPGVRAIRIGPKAGYQPLYDWLGTAAPGLADRLVQGAVDVLEAIPALVDPVVPLPGGAALTIEATEALTAIDVDSGAVRTGLAANLAAATAIPGQLRLRNIGGIVVIDFVSLSRRTEEAEIMTRLRAGLAGDSADIRLGAGFSPLGLVELARRRRGRSLAEAVAGTSFLPRRADR